jgi:hypothetical protein
MTTQKLPIGTIVKLSGTLGDDYMIVSSRTSYHGEWYTFRSVEWADLMESYVEGAYEIRLPVSA